MKPSDLRDKKVAVLGLSVEGISTVKFLAKNGAIVTACDHKGGAELGNNFNDLIGMGIKDLRVGDRYLENLQQFEMVFRTPGMPLNTPQLVEAKKDGVTISSQTKLFFDLCPCPIIGVTGTKGKGTTATLIYEILKKSGYDVYLGGNIGLSPLDFLEKLTADSHVVLELSSFQLEDLEKSPQIAVVLMVTSEHLASQAPDSPNYHKSLANYIKAKERVVRYQREGDWAVVNYDYQNSRKMAKITKAQTYFFSSRVELKQGVYVKFGKIIFRKEKFEEVCAVSDIFIRGEHNWENVCAAVCVGKILGIENKTIREAVAGFKGLEHRLEFVREIGGVNYYNDSFSTTPETAIAALRSFTRPLIIILGGSEKGSNYLKLGRVVGQMENLKAVFLIGNTAGQIEAAVKTGGGFKDGVKVIRGFGSMQPIVKTAASLAQKGDTVLLSPGCASFDMFKNYKVRGEQFKKDVLSL